MNIGVDIDGVLTDYCKFLYSDCKKFFRKKCNKKGYWISETYDITKEEEDKMWKALYLQYLQNAKVRFASRWFLRRLKKLGHTIFLITARGGHGEDSKIPPEQEIVETQNWLKKNNLIYDSLNSTTGSKVNFCKEHNIAVMIDDAPHQILSVGEEIDLIIIDASYNRNINAKKAKRKRTWLGVVREIIKLNKSKNSHKLTN